VQPYWYPRVMRSCLRLTVAALVAAAATGLPMYVIVAQGVDAPPLARVVCQFLTIPAGVATRLFVAPFGGGLTSVLMVGGAANVLCWAALTWILMGAARRSPPRTGPR
jgi:hypothetical protein